jgi:hypothetical protein
LSASAHSLDETADDTNDVLVQRALLQEATMQCRLLENRSDTSRLESTPSPVAPHVPMTSSYGSPYALCTPSIAPSHNTPVYRNNLGPNATTLPYETAIENSLDENLPDEITQANAMPLHEDARRALSAFFRAAENVIPVDLSDTTFLPTPPNASQRTVSAASEQVSSPPPAYQRHANNSQNLSAHAPSFIPSSQILNTTSRSRIPLLEASWNVMNALPHRPGVLADGTAVDRAYRRCVHLLDRYNILVQDMGYEDINLDACMRDLLLPYTPNQESLHAFYRRLYVAEQVLRVNESICDGTYQPPNPVQSINSIPTYNIFRREVSPVRSNVSTSPAHSIVSSAHSRTSSCHSGPPRQTVRVESVTDEDDEHPRHSGVGNVPMPQLIPIAPHQGMSNTLPPALRLYVPGRQREINIRYVDRIAFALFKHGLSTVDPASASSPDKESNRVKVIDRLLSRVIDYRGRFPDDTEAHIDE